MRFDNDYNNTLDGDNIGVDLRRIAFTTHPAKDQLQETKAKIFQGASKIELAFMGEGKPSLSRGNTTPGLYGREHREALKSIAKVNEVELTTHATIAVQGLAGGTREGHFSENQRINSVSEIKQAIEFNADVGGGAVVVHTGEFSRPTEFGKKFVSFGEGIPQSLVDDRTGQAVFQFNKNTEMEVPEYKYNEQKREIKLEPGKIRVGDQTANQVKDMMKKHFSEQAVMLHKGFTEQYQNELERMEEVYHDYKKGDKSQKLRVLTSLPDYANMVRKAKTEEELYKFGEKAIEEKRNHVKNITLGYYQDVIKQEQMADHLVTQEEYAVKKSAQSLAEAGLYAMEQTKQKKVERPVFVSPENIFVEQYGGHPQELKKLILESRNQMKDMLIKKGKSESEAQRLSEQHIKATFDVGHANTWKKYFKGEDKDFQKWLINQTRDLMKSNVIGHVHITDNMGYADDHLPPGEGTVPIKEFTKALKEEGYKGTIVAEGGDWEHQNLLGAWRALNSPIYKTQTWSDIEDSYLGRTHSPSYLVGQAAPSEEFRGAEQGKPMWSGIPLE